MFALPRTLISAPSFLDELVSLSTPAPSNNRDAENQEQVLGELESTAMASFSSLIAATGTVVPGNFLGTIVANPVVQLLPDFYKVIGAANSIAYTNAQVIASQVNESAREHPSIWYVGFPAYVGFSPNMGSQQERPKRFQQRMTDSRCWSCLNWWQEVYRQIPNGSNINFQVAQGRLFAKLACQDMAQMAWLQTLREPREVPNSFECSPADIHADIIFRSVADMVGDRALAADVVEPVLKSIVNSVASGVQMARQLKTVIAERYEYVAGDIRSYVRMLCFEMAEGMHDVQTGKNSSERRVSINFSFVQYEAIFNMEAWEQHSRTLQQHEKEAMKEFVNRQSYNIPL